MPVHASLHELGSANPGKSRARHVQVLAGSRRDGGSRRRGSPVCDDTHNRPRERTSSDVCRRSRQPEGNA